MRVRNAALVAVSLATAACASGGASSSQNAGQPATIDASGAVTYSGDFRPIQQNTGAVGMQAQQRIYGSVRLIFRESTSRTNVALRLNTNNQASEVLTWGVVPGRCGSGGVPVSPVSQLPAIEVSNMGQGEVNRDEVPLSLPAGSTYHVNVYRGGDSLRDVIACANLSSRE
jgi:hypothetical protein